MSCTRDELSTGEPGSALLCGQLEWPLLKQFCFSSTTQLAALLRDLCTAPAHRPAAAAARAGGAVLGRTGCVPSPAVSPLHPSQQEEESLPPEHLLHTVFLPFCCICLKPS